jgi:hypothetical protein
MVNENILKHYHSPTLKRIKIRILSVKCYKTNNTPVFFQFLVDQPILSKHQTVYHHIRLHPTLSNELEDDQPSSRFVLAAPSEVTPITIGSRDSVIPSKAKLKKENKNLK